MTLLTPHNDYNKDEEIRMVKFDLNQMQETLNVKCDMIRNLNWQIETSKKKQLHET